MHISAAQPPAAILSSKNLTRVAVSVPSAIVILGLFASLPFWLTAGAIAISLGLALFGLGRLVVYAAICGWRYHIAI